MEDSDPRQQLESFKQNDAYRQLLAFTEVKDAFLRTEIVCERILGTNILCRVLSQGSRIYPLNWKWLQVI